MKLKFCIGLTLSSNDAVIKNVPKSVDVGFIVYVYPDNVTKKGKVLDEKVIGSPSGSIAVGKVYVIDCPYTTC